MGNSLQKTIKFLEVNNENSKEFEEIMQIYEETFPVEERNPRASIERALKEKRKKRFKKLGLFSHLIGMKFKNQMIGLSYFNYFSGPSLGFLGYIGITPKFQGQGFGKKLLNQIIETIREDAKEIGEKEPIGLAAEVEKEEQPDITREVREARNRRIGFFRSQGAKIIEGVDYFQPSLTEDQPTIPLWLMIIPLNQEYWERLTPEKISQVIKAIYKKVYVIHDGCPYDKKFIEKLIKSINPERLKWR